MRMALDNKCPLWAESGHIKNNLETEKTAVAHSLSYAVFLLNKK